MKPHPSSFDVCILGGGPSGSTLAIRLAQLGLTVALIERSRFPRKHVGESLSPGVPALLDAIGALSVLENVHARPVHRIHLRWEHGLQFRDDPKSQGHIVDRAFFDQKLLRLAQALGVCVFQPATAHSFEGDALWHLTVQPSTASDPSASPLSLSCRFLADATGRSRALRGAKRAYGHPTLALCAYWEGHSFPPEPQMEAGQHAWFWGVPLPDGTFHTLAFVDRHHIRKAPRTSLQERFLELLAQSHLLRGLSTARLSGPVRAVDASAYVAEDPVTPRCIRVGEAALALDPLSSSGVQKAMQSALSAAVVIHTLLQRPERQDAAIRFYQDSLCSAAAQHQQWAGAHYRAMRALHPTAFWNARSIEPPQEGASLHPQPLPSASMDLDSGHPAAWRLCPQVQWIPTPCLGAEFVEVEPALSHPNLSQPIVYLGGVRLAHLLLPFPAVLPARHLVAWCARVFPRAQAESVARWLLAHRLLIAAPLAPDLNTPLPLQTPPV